MIPITAAQLLNLPEGASTGAAQRLPWANGSLLAAKLSPTDTPGMAYLLLGGFRLRAKVPPSTPMGNVWLQLVHHEMPAHFRLLTEAQAERVLTQMLHKLSADQGQQTVPKHTRDHGWTSLDTDMFPFTADISEDRKNLLLRDRENGTPHVILSQSSDTDRFRIQGRLDLEHIGPLLFTLEGGSERNWQLRIFIDNPLAISHLRTPFDTWLIDQQKGFASLDGTLSLGLPDCLSALTEDIQA